MKRGKQFRIAEDKERERIWIKYIQENVFIYQN